MLLPVNWLENYVDINVDNKEFADRLTLSGSNVESIKSLDKDIENVVVGKILSIVPHEDADKLVVCQVDVGEEKLQIVTGASNMKEGDYVVVAKVGALLPGDFHIKETKLRGVESYGMMCSLEELGYKKDVLTKEMLDGILILDKEYEPGTDIVEVLNLDTNVLEIEITPNRPDCLSIIGLARETSAALKSELKLPKIEIKEEISSIDNYIEDVKIESEKCRRYYTRVIKDVKVEESPLWLQMHLINAGVKPVNNIVDITNFVMLEYGEPLHAFDYDNIEGKNIIVREGQKGEKIKTLDHIEREVDEGDILICDEKNILAIAGIMGSLDSEIKKDTQTVLLEGANFDEKSIRLSSRKFNLRSDASFRFEKGIDPNIANLAVDRACQLIEELGAGKVVAGNIDKYREKREEKIVKLRPERVNKVLGTNIDVEEMLEHLNSLGLKSELKDKCIESIIPTYRRDIHIEADLVEEVGRLYGFHNIEKKALYTSVSQGKKTYSKRLQDIVKMTMTGLGFNEVMTYSFISPKSFDKLRLDQDDPARKYIELINPLGLEYSVMRTTLVPTMLELLSRNYNRGVESVYAFEIGNIFIPNELPVQTLPKEKKVLSIGFYGEEDFYFIKDVVNKTLARLGIESLRYERESQNPSYHPGRTAKILVDGKQLGTIGELHPDVLENYNIGKRVYVAELDFEYIMNLADLDVSFKQLPKYPAITRDIALVVDKDILVGEIEDIIYKHGKDLVEDVKLFDIYTGEQLDKDKKSVAYSITYRSYESTLKDDEVNRIQNLIIKDLEDKLGGELRR